MTFALRHEPDVVQALLAEDPFHLDPQPRGGDRSTNPAANHRLFFAVYFVDHTGSRRGRNYKMPNDVARHTYESSQIILWYSGNPVVGTGENQSVGEIAIRGMAIDDSVLFYQTEQEFEDTQRLQAELNRRSRLSAEEAESRGFWDNENGRLDLAKLRYTGLDPVLRLLIDIRTERLGPDYARLHLEGDVAIAHAATLMMNYVRTPSAGRGIERKRFTELRRTPYALLSESIPGLPEENEMLGRVIRTAEAALFNIDELAEHGFFNSPNDSPEAMVELYGHRDTTEDPGFHPNL